MSKFKVDDVICFAGDRNAKVQIMRVSLIKYTLKSLKTNYMYDLSIIEVDKNYMYLYTENQQEMDLGDGLDYPPNFIDPLYCSCNNRKEITNHAMGKVFKYCTNCKKEIK